MSQVPRLWRGFPFKEGFGVDVTYGQFSGLPIKVSEAPMGILERMGLTPNVIFANGELEKQLADLSLSELIPISAAILGVQVKSE